MKYKSTMKYKDTIEELQDKLGGLVPELEFKYKAELIDEIRRIKKEKNAVILGHNYMEPALFHTIPDITGDSLELCRKAAETEADIIVFCGVEFMAETAKVLNPTKKVLVPSDKAGCSLAESITVADVRAMKKRYPGAPVVCYINTYADIKAEIDICCTSGNASKIIESLQAEKIIFIPDEYLSKNVAKETGKKIYFPDMSKAPSEMSKEERQLESEAELIGWAGRCEVHELFTVKDIKEARQQYQDITILAHPECSPEVTGAADFSGSTSAMINFVEKTDKQRYLLLTECAMGDNVAVANKDKEMVRMCNLRCRHMNQITLEDTLRALQEEIFEVQVPENIRILAEKSVKRMLEI